MSPVATLEDELAGEPQILLLADIVFVSKLDSKPVGPIVQCWQQLLWCPEFVGRKDVSADIVKVVCGQRTNNAL